jgi:HNH endonuclease
MRNIREDPRGPAIPHIARRTVKRRYCQICGAEYGRIHLRYSFAKASRPWIPREHLDHIIPARFVTGRSLGDPNAIVNLLSTCHRCNLAKKTAEDCLFKADTLGFVANLQRRGWGFELKRAAKYFGLDEIVSLIRL